MDRYNTFDIGAFYSPYNKKKRYYPYKIDEIIRRGKKIKQLYYFYLSNKGDVNYATIELNRVLKLWRREDDNKTLLEVLEEKGILK